MKFSSKFALIPMVFIFLAACSSSPTNVIPKTQPTLTEQINTLTPTKKPLPTLTPQPTNTNTPAPTETSTPFPTKEVLLQYGIFGGDGGWYTDFYFGRDTPTLILYTDGQLLIKKKDNKGIWFDETMLTVSQMCSFLSQIEKTGFFSVESNGSRGTDDPIYKFDSTAQFSEGGPVYVIQINGNKHKAVSIYYDYVPYLIPEVKQVFNLFSKYHSPNKLSDYQAKYMLLWIEKGLGDSIYSTPAPFTQSWPTNLPSLDELEKDKVETAVYLEGDYAKQVSQVLVKNEYVKPIFELFDNRLAYKLFQTENSQYYVIPRPLLPHETPQDFSPFPYQEKEFDLPFRCTN